MLSFLVDKGLEAFQLSRDRSAILRLLYLECRTNLGILDVVLRGLAASDDTPQEVSFAHLDGALSLDVLGSVFMTGPAEDGALEALRNLEITGDAGEEPEGQASDFLSSLYVRSSVLMRLAGMEGSGLVGSVDYPTRIRWLRNDFLKVVKALGEKGIQS